MSNKDDDFRFDDEDDLFRNDDEFSSFDAFDDSEDIDAELIDFGGDDELDLGGEEAPEERSGTSRTFIILAVVLIVILLLGFGVLLFAVIGGGGGNPELNATRTAIAEQNATTLAQLATIDAQQTESFIATATAMSFTPTPSPSFTPSPTSTPTDDLTATAQALNIEATQSAQSTLDAIAFSQTATQEALGIGGGGDDATPTLESGMVITPISQDAVAQTATALVSLLDPANLTAIAGGDGGTGGPLATPTRTLPTGPTGGSDTQLPDTGLFDELNAGTMGALGVVAFGLVGIIFIARRARGGTRR
jgi:hypothetical protein